MTNRRLLLPSCFVVLALCLVHAADKPKLTLDEFFNYTDVPAVAISPDGNSIVINTEQADWGQNIFRRELWLYRDGHGGELTQLTQSGDNTKPEWSPDGRWIAFLSERKTAKPPDEDDPKEEATAQLYLISVEGGEAFPVTRGEEEIHSFSWSPDSRILYFAKRTPWSKTQNDAYKKEWEDTIQYRAAERGDTVFSIEVAGAITRHAVEGSQSAGDSSDESDTTPGSRALAMTPWHVAELEASPDGRTLAFATQSVSGREEKIEEYEIYSVELTHASAERPPRQLTHNHAIEGNIHWAKDGKHIFFQLQYGSVDGPYQDRQIRLYWLDADSDEIQRWASDFGGAVLGYAITSDGGVFATGQLGTEVQTYFQARISAPFSKQPGIAGTYAHLATAARSRRIALVHSAIEEPLEVYVADSSDTLKSARPITSFNQLFTQRDLPKAKPYRWTADDGTTIEGMLMYPPEKFEAKHLPMFVFIHGGPDDADGNHFEADWYVWDRLAATQGWLVFEPNYRGSEGYGDKFLMGIVPEIVSRPGKDVLEGVDALVRDGIADPDRLTVGGYSYGGYLTNWLITQTPRFKAAVTGAGAVENVVNWGVDDTTFDDAYFLGGRPWEAPQRYHDEAAIFQIDKVRTPTHIVSGADDIRVAAAEAYLLDQALHALDVPSTLLLFPGEDHELDKNPWHGKIKVREELKWLEKYGGIAADR
jgi:dipeptidyl aminopeptidase/acylaminoacyl peptidase